MIEINDEIYRNLQEQVLKNQQDILKLKAGIKIDYTVDSVEELQNLPQVEIGTYAFVKGDSEESGLYVYARDYEQGTGSWVFLSKYPIGLKGEQGIQGRPGVQGQRAPGIFGVTTDPPLSTKYIEGDMYLTTNGDLYVNVNHSWVKKSNIKGVQGSNVMVIANPSGDAPNNLTTINIAGVNYTVSGTIYTAGEGIDITNEEISLYGEVRKFNQYAEFDENGKLTLGNGLYVDGQIEAESGLKSNDKIQLGGLTYFVDFDNNKLVDSLGDEDIDSILV